MRTVSIIPFIFLVLTIGLCADIGSGAPPAVPCATDTSVRDVKVPNIVHPCENAHLPALKSTFVFGAADPHGTLTINGRPVPIHPGGGFLSMVNLSSGTFTITAELALGATTHVVIRKIVVDGPALPSPVSPLTVEYVRPDMGIEAQTGDEIPVSCKGSPGMAASFTVDGVKGKFPMLEAGDSGIYRGTYIVGQKDKLRGSKIKVMLRDGKTGKKKVLASGRVISLFSDSTPVMVEVASANAVLRAGPAMSCGDKAGYMLFPPIGTPLDVTGSWGDELRVRLSKSRDAWIGKGEVRTLPQGTVPARAVTGNITVVGSSRNAEIRVPLGRKVPFEVLPDDNGKCIDVRFFGTVSNTDWINYTSSGVVEQVRWFQDDSDTFRIHAIAVGNWWGYDARFEGTTFVLELRCPPSAPAARDLPLEGITVAVDPGHSPDTGAVGPTGLVERDANLAIALCLKEKLTAVGACVVMTREGREGVALYERPKRAWKARADILVSVHNNALADGENPFEKNGYGVYYYHPQSCALAREIHAAYGELVGKAGSFDTPLRDDGLHYGNLALPRTMQMPSVLTESSYIIIPGEEALLKTQKFQAACADAIVRGLQRYVSHMRPSAAAARKAISATRKKSAPALKK
jgi:N-acetylmuramoyl-L-alanine amidase